MGFTKNSYFFRVLDHIMDLKQDNIKGVTKMKSLVASLPPVVFLMEQDDLLVYEPKYVHHAHTVV